MYITAMRLKRMPLPDRIRSFQANADPDGCWLWPGCTSDGYGRGYASNKGRKVTVHRFAYELLVGPIPDGLHIDHLCRNPRCFNPAHLEPVTPKENNRRGKNCGVFNTPADHCPRGHAYTDDNAYWSKGKYRMCKTCVTARYKPVPLERRKQRVYGSTVCLRGHSITGDNVYYRKDGRVRCRQCVLDNVRKHSR